MKRKAFIRLSAFVTAAISIPFLHSCSISSGEQALSQPAFLSRLFDKDMIRDAGKAYLQKTPSENNNDKLIQLLVENNPVADATDKKTIPQYLDNKIKQDFETGNIVMVKGWVLAVTEARQCALFSLVNG